MTEEFKRENNGKQEIEEEQKEQEEKEEKVTKPVIINAEAYKTIILYASRYSNQAIPPKDWKEIYGILTGYSDDDFVYVENAYALTFGHDADVQLDNRHYVFISEIEDKLYSEDKGHYVVGWFHSHPGLSLFFSDIDLRNQLWFQENNPDFCGLVFDHTLLGKKKEEKIGENILTKYDTGFEIYRINDVTMNPNSPQFENNYHKVDYIVKGLNKYFFANVLSELSALVSAGKPLQSAYKEDDKLESNYKNNQNFEKNDLNSERIISEIDIRTEPKDLVDIPMNEDFSFGFSNLFYDTSNQENLSDSTNLKEQAEYLIYEGNKAFQNKDTFTGIERYRKGIEKYKELDDINRVLDLLRTVAKLCISNNHLVLAEEFADELFRLSKQNDELFYLGVASYIIGYISLKKGDIQILKDALKKIENSAIYFGKVMDYAGAGMSYNKIATIYQTRLKNYDSACLFYKEAIENYNKAIIHS
ncbi:MAG: Mov34/MPN/PAD-1 family protein, partial [Promethearchaeota archaeon]